MRNFRSLQVWTKSVAFSKLLYKITANFPSQEKYVLTSQLQRASVSMASNIAEGASRSSDLEFKRFLEISLGSAFEIETQLLICKEIELISEDNFVELVTEIEEIQKMLNAFITKLKAKS